MSEREQTVAEAHAFVVAAERLAEAARRWFAHLNYSDCIGAEELRQALAEFERVREQK